MGKITGDYLWRMEDILAQYERPYDPAWPLVCFDERPCFLLEATGGILPMSPGQAKREHHEYTKNGACCVLLAFEPHTGLRYLEVRARRTGVDYAEFMQTLLEVYYPQAKGVRIVQDNLNTHTPGTFYEVLPAADAFALAQRFDMHYTPKRGSWLNMAEIEFAALARQCLNRRLPTQAALEREAVAWMEQRNEKGVTVEWTFAHTKAREKLKRHYDLVNKLS